MSATTCNQPPSATFLLHQCHAQDATLSSIWHEGLVRDRSASRRVARMYIVTSTCTEKKIYIYIYRIGLHSPQTTSESHQYITQTSRVRAGSDYGRKQTRKRRTTSILAIPGCRRGTHPRSKKKKKKQLQMNNQRARVK